MTTDVHPTLADQTTDSNGEGTPRTRGSAPNEAPVAGSARPADQPPAGALSDLPELAPTIGASLEAGPTRYTVMVSDLQVEVVRKPVKHLHIGVHPPDGAIRASAPLAMSATAVHAALVGRLPWMRQQRAAFAAQPRETPREMVSGESHWVFGRRLRLRVELAPGRTRITLQGKRTLHMRIAPDRSPQARREALQRWYRAQLRAVLTPLIGTWSTRLGVTPSGWRIQRMKTRWGSCSPRTHALLFNLELAKHSPACIEYIVVHELAHLRVPNHGDAFVALLDAQLPNWRVLRKELGEGVLGV